MRVGIIGLSLAALLAASPARAVSIRELANYEQPVLVTHIMGSLTGAATGLALAGNQQAAACVRRWAAPAAMGGHDPQALTDILTRLADALSRLKGGGRVPDYEELLTAALHAQCGTALPSRP